MLNALDVHKEPLTMWIIVNAIFETQSLFSYLVFDKLDALEEECLGLKSVDGITCLSIHTNFTCSWLQSEKICNERNGRLWWANSKEKWNEVMRSSMHRWHLANDNFAEQLEYDGRINVVSLLHSSSLLYLRPSGDPQEVSSGKIIQAEISFSRFNPIFTLVD